MILLRSIIEIIMCEFIASKTKPFNSNTLFVIIIILKILMEITMSNAFWLEMLPFLNDRAFIIRL